MNKNLQEKRMKHCLVAEALDMVETPILQAQIEAERV